MDSGLLFDDTFTVSSTSKTFDRVVRIIARSDNYGMDLVLDVNSDLYPMKDDDRFALALAPTLYTEGEAGAPTAAGGQAPDANAWRKASSRRMDEYDYIMYGRVYKFDEAAKERVTAYASYGGLIMALTGSYRHLSTISVGQAIYLLMRR